MSPKRFDPSVVESRLTTMTVLLDDLAAFGDDDLEQDRRPATPSSAS